MNSNYLMLFLRDSLQLLGAFIAPICRVLQHNAQVIYIKSQQTNVQIQRNVRIRSLLLQFMFPRDQSIVRFQ